MSISIVVLGDICPERGYPEFFASSDEKKIFNDLLEVFEEADYVVANLEAPVTNKTIKGYKNSVCFKSSPSDASVLKNAGISAVALANNHILDYCTEGLEDTIQILTDAGIEHYGAGNIDEAARPLIVDIEGIKIGFMAFAEQEFNCAFDYGIGANLWDDFDGIKSIHNAKKQCDYLVIQYHGGIEHYIYPSPWLQKKCRAMADAGADFITCQHSHCIGTREKWNGTEILYGQGNSIFGFVENNSKWNQGLICKIIIDTDSFDYSVSYIPIVASSDGEKLAERSEADDILSIFEKESGKILDKCFVLDKWRDFCASQAKVYLPMQFGWNINLIRANRLTRGKLINLFVKPVYRRNAMNLIRCDSHREVLTTILSEDYNNTYLK